MAKTQLFWVFILSPGTSTRGATRDLAIPAIPHPITIQNMRFEEEKTNW